MSARITALFPSWAFLVCLVASARPEWFVGAKPLIVPLHGLVMLGMGITLSWRSFAEVLRRPAEVGIGLLL